MHQYLAYLGTTYSMLLVIHEWMYRRKMDNYMFLCFASDVV